MLRSLVLGASLFAVAGVANAGTVQCRVDPNVCSFYVTEWGCGVPQPSGGCEHCWCDEGGQEVCNANPGDACVTTAPPPLDFSTPAYDFSTNTGPPPSGGGGGGGGCDMTSHGNAGASLAGGLLLVAGALLLRRRRATALRR